jgi:hypothetical protein
MMNSSVFENKNFSPAINQLTTTTTIAAATTTTTTRSPLGGVVVASEADGHLSFADWTHDSDLSPTPNHLRSVGSHGGVSKVTFSGTS